ncbi:hypothetical protein ACJX0J_016767, partial [Zea mays]
MSVDYGIIALLHACIIFYDFKYHRSTFSFSFFIAGLSLELTSFQQFSFSRCITFDIDIFMYMNMSPLHVFVVTGLIHMILDSPCMFAHVWGWMITKIHNINMKDTNRT